MSGKVTDVRHEIRTDGEELIPVTEKAKDWFNWHHPLASTDTVIGMLMDAGFRIDTVYPEGLSMIPDDADYDDSMDGDHESALASAGWGTDEDYGYFGETEDF
tara:strand:+ start:182 stop:490 length:309 start_codon:yes stop_codon:yes gene_type:complete